jgi:polar amino acid transport system permease protein
VRTGATDLPVLKPFRAPPIAPSGLAAPAMLSAGVVASACLLFVASLAFAQAAAPPTRDGALTILLRWTPLIFHGFLFNLLISFLSMALGTVIGVLFGIGQVSPSAALRKPAWAATQFFRNAPWLVLLFYCMLLLPFELTIGGAIIPLPAWMKATAGLALAVMANVSELVRGAVQSIPFGQWEASEALAFSRRQTLWMIILPQCVKRMLPPWMNLYAILVVGTALASIVGVNESMTLTGDILAAENRTELLVPMYLYLLLWFFAYCYPIARATVSLERRFQVR